MRLPWAHPWTNGPVERMNRTLKEATIQRFHYQTTAEQLRTAVVKAGVMDFFEAAGE